MGLKYFLYISMYSILFFFTKNTLAGKDEDRKILFNSMSTIEDCKERIFFTLVKAKLYLDFEPYEDFEKFKDTYQKNKDEAIKKYTIVFEKSERIIQEYLKIFSLDTEQDAIAQLSVLVKSKIESMQNVLEKLRPILESYKKIIPISFRKECFYEYQSAMEKNCKALEDLEIFFFNPCSNIRSQSTLEALEENIYDIGFKVLCKDLLEAINKNFMMKDFFSTPLEEKNIVINIEKKLAIYSSCSDKYKAFSMFVEFFKQYFENKKRGDVQIEKIRNDLPHVAQGLLLNKVNLNILNVIFKLNSKENENSHEDINHEINLLAQYNAFFIDEIKYLEGPRSPLFVHEKLLEEIKTYRPYEETSSELSVLGLKMMRFVDNSNSFLEAWKNFWENIDKYHNYKLLAEAHRC